MSKSLVEKFKEIFGITKNDQVEGPDKARDPSYQGSPAVTLPADDETGSMPRSKEEAKSSIDQAEQDYQSK